MLQGFVLFLFVVYLIIAFGFFFQETIIAGTRHRHRDVAKVAFSWPYYVVRHIVRRW